MQQSNIKNRKKIELQFLQNTILQLQLTDYKNVNKHKDNHTNIPLLNHRFSIERYQVAS